jgi:hypothetical protein
MTRLCVISSDFRLFYKISKIFADKYQISHIFPSDNIPDNDLVITTLEEARFVKVQPKVVLQWKMNPSLMEKKIIESLENNSSNEQITIGIDPGKNIGVSIILQDSLVTSNTLDSTQKLIYWLRNEFKVLKITNPIIKIGDGDMNSVEEIIPALIHEFGSELDINLVDESDTSKRENKSRTSHEESADRIARKSV